MAKKVLSVLLAVMMIAALCTVAFVSTSAAEYATIKVGGKDYTVKVGDNFTIKKSVALPDGYAVNGGKVEMLYNVADGVVEAIKVENEDGDLKYALTAFSGTAPSGMKEDNSGVSFAAAADSFSKKNALSASNDNFATFTFTVKKAGTAEFSEVFDLQLFSNADDAAMTTPIPVIVSGAAVEGQEELFAQIKTATIVTVPTYEFADMTKLNEAIALGDEALATEGEYTEESMAALKAAVDAGKAIAAKAADEVSQADVDAAEKAITDALNNLVIIVDTPEELQLVVDAVKKITPDGLTKESYKALQDAIAAAEAVLANPNATAQEIMDACAAIEAAVAGLEEVPANPANPDNPDNPANPDNPDNPSGGNHQPSGNGKDPNTGDAATSVFVMLAVLALAGSVVVVARKRATK